MLLSVVAFCDFLTCSKNFLHSDNVYLFILKIAESQKRETWPRLFEGLTKPFIRLISIRWVVHDVFLTLTQWIVIHPLDCVIRLLNN